MDIMTPKEVAYLIKIPVGTLAYWRHAGIGPKHFKLGKHARYYKKDINAWLEAAKEYQELVND